MNNKLIGGILLIIGTSIGGGLIALPIATASLGFIPALLLLILCWAMMTASAFLILEVNLWNPSHSHLITMAKTTLGRFGQFTTWVAYLLLLYALLAAYIAGASDFLQHFFQGFHIVLSTKLCALLFTSLLGLVVYKGIHSIDYANRGLMLSKLVSYLLLVACTLPFVSSHYLLALGENYTLTGIVGSSTVIITSFGFAIIVPSLRSYFQNDVRLIRRAILIGSLIPLFSYMLWEAAIMGVIPLQGETNLVSIGHSNHPTGNLIQALSHLLHQSQINFLVKIFMAICLTTSFLGVALSLFDFLGDGLPIKKQGKNKWLLSAITFLPPLLIASYNPHIFIKALSYAGILCTLLLVLLPAMMAWSGRYIKKQTAPYQVVGGKYLLVSLIVSSLFIISLSLAS